MGHTNVGYHIIPQTLHGTGIYAAAPPLAVSRQSGLAVRSVVGTEMVWGKAETTRRLDGGVSSVRLSHRFVFDPSSFMSLSLSL